MSDPHIRVTPQFKALRWRLLLTSLGVIGCTLTAFGMVVYQVIAQSLEQKSDRQLELLADAAAHSLPDIAADRVKIATRTPRSLDDDGDLDIPWQDLQQDLQGVEWFDPTGQLLGRAGKLFSDAVPPSEAIADLEVGDEDNLEGAADNEMHRLTISVYKAKHRLGEPKLQGYVRVTQSNQAIAEELERVRAGLQWGSLLALGLSGLGGWWLTQQSLRPIEHSMQQLKQFTADASHELRNPLTAIKASVEVMLSHEERLNPADLPKLDAIASATVQMSQLVDDLLWLARSDRTHVPTCTVTIPLEDLLEDVLDQYMPQAEQKHIDLKADLHSHLSVLGDPQQLKRLFANLVTNALHYTPSGGTVTLSSSLEPDDWVSVRIVDTGIGIAPEHLPFIFDRFWRADQGRAHREGGSGLGLAIAQAIAHQHQGKIMVQPQPSGGTCFQVELPTA